MNLTEQAISACKDAQRLAREAQQMVRERDARILELEQIEKRYETVRDMHIDKMVEIIEDASDWAAGHDYQTQEKFNELFNAQFDSLIDKAIQLKGE